MSESQATYCRLCAEPTSKDGLITATEDVAVNSKIVMKLEWINIDISQESPLPNTICFSCFDLLERTYNFLNTVRTAQIQLTKIFVPKTNDEGNGAFKLDISLNVGKPVNKDWDDFEDTKNIIKCENPDLIIKSGFSHIVELSGVDSSTFQNDIVGMKLEPPSDPENNNFGGSSSDSDNLPLHLTLKRKKKKKKTSLTKLLSKLKNENSEDMLNIPVVTWENYLCRCAQCDAQCKNVAALQLHSLHIHMNCCVFKCTDCDKVMSNFKLFITHVRHLHHKRLRYFCEYCNKQFEMHDLIKLHQKQEHPNNCKSCGTSFNSNNELQDHLLIYSKEYKRQRKRETKSENNILKCKHCDKEFKSISNLNQHKIVHTERIRNFSCHVCGKMFFTKGTLGTHMATHEETKPFKCEFCPLSFRARGNLLSHSSLHTGAKPFVCEQCGRSFRVKRHLKSHSIIHTDLMPYVCEFCNKPFRFKTRLNLHLRQHTGAKPYHCLFCRRDFTNGSNFKKHMKRRHNVDTSKKKYNVLNEEQINLNNHINIQDEIQT